MPNKCDSVCVAQEAVLLFLYAWCSCCKPGIKIPHSLVAIGREFAFSIEYSTNKHWELTSSPISVESYSRDITTHFSDFARLPTYLSTNTMLTVVSYHLLLSGSLHIFCW
jgi:hypothetical protein